MIDPAQPSDCPEEDSGCLGLLGQIPVVGLPRGDPAVSSARVLQGLGDSADSLDEGGFHENQMR